MIVPHTDYVLNVAMVGMNERVCCCFCFVAVALLEYHHFTLPIQYSHNLQNENVFCLSTCALLIWTVCIFCSSFRFDICVSHFFCPIVYPKERAEPCIGEHESVCCAYFSCLFVLFSLPRIECVYRLHHTETDHGNMSNALTHTHV